CLKPNPGERPPTAVEVYLRLQELGKASGILLLPPGAMDRLVAARKAGEPTGPYTPTTAEGKANGKRRFLIGLAAVIAVLGLAALVKYVFFSPAPAPTGPETLHGIKLGDTSDDVDESLTLSKVDLGNPWNRRTTKGRLGHVLKPEDLKLSP